MSPVERPPDWLEVLGALAVVEAWLAAQLQWLRDRNLGDPATLARLEEMLAVKARSLEALTALAMEVQVLLAGSGPVDHDPVDFAWDPAVDDPETPPGA